MAIARPTLEQLLAISSSLHMQLDAQQADEYLALMQASFDAYDLVDELPDFIPPVRYERSSGYRPSAAHNPLNAWYFRTEVNGAREGKLAGKTVALKDNISPPFSARQRANTTACPAAATPPILHRCTTPIAKGLPRVVRLPAAQRWSLPARSTWPSAVTRAAQSASLPPSAALTA